MAIRESKTINGKTQYLFLNIHGSGWIKKVYIVIAQYIYPEYLERKHLGTSIDGLVSLLIFRKNQVEIKVEFDQYDCITIFSDDEKCSPEILKYWADLIDENIPN